MHRTALDLAEESVRLLQKQSAAVWLQYLLGAVPFLLALLAFEHDMALGYNLSRCAPESFVCAILFLWLNAWKSRFSFSLLSALSGEDSSGKRNSFAQCFLFQTIIQTTKLVVLPLAAISVLPFPWVSAFYRNATLEAGRAGSFLSGILRRSSEHASADSRQNWIVLCLFAVISLVVLINTLLLLLLLPQLIRALTGSESDWTRNSSHALNSQTLLEAVTLTWFVLNPVLQSFAVLQCFYAAARKDGRDLLASLRRLAAVTSLLLITTIGSTCLHAATVPQTELDRGINKALESDEYAWRLAQNDGDSNALQRWTRQLGNGITAALKYVDSWLTAFGKWFRKLFHQDGEAGVHPLRPVKPDRSLPWIVGGLVAVIALALVIVIVRKRLGEPVNPSVKATASAKADLSNDNLLASDMPEDEWLLLAKGYVEKGELRLAVRAMYLSSLASLGRQQLLVITRWKSNRLYERELQIRSRADALCDVFASSNRDYERVWFGLHEVTREQLQNFEDRLQTIRAYGPS